MARLPAMRIPMSLPVLCGLLLPGFLLLQPVPVDLRKGDIDMRVQVFDLKFVR